MDSAKTQLVEKIRSASNILVTVSRNPSVDQLAACLGLTLLLNKLDKHATAVFSGEVPSTMEFLEPEQTLEKNTDSLRDFIIALDKSKADKLRYKVEDQLVRIFITPYRTSINQNDLEFSQGDFNVDLVIALGVQRQEDLDEAITSHGRILHDATVASINVAPASGLGSINWQVPAASSLSELVTDMSRELGQGLLDEQIATALLTGIVAETQRFSNEKTSPQTMSASAELMAAGANQQLVATKLEEQPAQKTPIAEHVEPVNEEQEENVPDQTPPPKSDDGTLEIEHDEDKPTQPDQTDRSVSDFEPTPPEQDDVYVPAPEASPNEYNDLPAPQPLPEEPQLVEEAESEIEVIPPFEETQSGEAVPKTSKLIIEPPELGATLNSTPQAEELEPSTDPLSLPAVEEPIPLLDRTPLGASSFPAPLPPEPLLTGFTPPPPAWVPPSADAFQPPPPIPVSQDDQPDDTLAELEAAVHSPHTEAHDLNEARDQVAQALSSSPSTPEPITALNAQPLGADLHSLAPPEPTVVQPSPDFMSTLQKTIPPASPLSSTSFPAPSYQGASAGVMQPEPATYEDAPGNEIVPSMIVPQPQPEMFASPQASAPLVSDPNAPPPVPPPIPFRFGNTTEPPRQ